MKSGQGVVPCYPVSLDVRGRRCVVVGGGEVALRKAVTLLEHGAAVEVISPEVCPELARLAADGAISVHRHAYGAGELAGAFMVIAATDNRAVNRGVAAEARRRAVLVNVVDDSEHSDFLVPSCFSRDGLTVAVSTAGQSPALARKIRCRLEKEITDAYGSLTRLVAEVRDETRRNGMNIDGERWQKALDIDLLLDLLERGEREEARATLLRRLQRDAGV